ncbi:MAG: hypothetical protein NZL83_01065 [Candidatus Absconditabacterales bacterium]|nr:hypothetical protein [Candidatus Absconditabacterales bacterium]
MIPTQPVPVYHGSADTPPATGSTKQGDISQSPYGTETNNAYLWAYENGITTIPTILGANIKGDLIRMHRAKCS